MDNFLMNKIVFVQNVNNNLKTVHYVPLYNAYNVKIVIWTLKLTYVKNNVQIDMEKIIQISVVLIVLKSFKFKVV